MQPVASVLSVGLSDLVSTRNAALRRAGFHVVAASSLKETAEACESGSFDVAVIGQILSAKEKTLLIHQIKADFHLPVVLMTGGASPHCPADAYVRADAPAEDLFQAITQLAAECAGPGHRVDIAAG
jgi:DNA-binding NtrC family response regulator